MKKFLGYVVVNTKTENFVDYNGSECKNSFETWFEKDGAQEIIDEVKEYVETHNNKHSRKVKKELKNIKIGKLYVEAYERRKNENT